MNYTNYIIGNKYRVCTGRSQFKTEVQRKCLKTEVQRKCLKTEVQRKCLFKCPSFGNIQVPSFGHDIFSVPPIQNGGTEIMSPQSNYGYRENVSSSVGLTFLFPRLVTFRFPRLVNQSNVSKKCIKNLFFFISGALS